jgi:hypothetical protein
MIRHSTGAVTFQKEIATMSKPKRLRSVDLRASWARRHRELAAAFASDLGADPSAADHSVVDFAATIAVECERMKASQLNGETVDLDALVRLANALTRVRRELGQKAAARKPKPLTFEERMRAREARKQANGSDNDL